MSQKCCQKVETQIFKQGQNSIIPARLYKNIFALRVSKKLSEGGNTNILNKVKI